MKRPDQATIQIVVVDRSEIDNTQLVQKAAFFRPDGTPIDISSGGGDPEVPEDLAAHVADPTPHMAALSGLNLAQLYAAGRI